MSNANIPPPPKGWQFRRNVFDDRCIDILKPDFRSLTVSENDCSIAEMALYELASVFAPKEDSDNG